MFRLISYLFNYIYLAPDDKQWVPIGIEKFDNRRVIDITLSQFRPEILVVTDNGM